MIHPRVLPSRCTRRLSLINSVMALKKDLDLSIHLITTFFEVHHMSRAANYNVSFQRNVSKCFVEPVGIFVSSDCFPFSSNDQGGRFDFRRVVKKLAAPCVGEIGIWAAWHLNAGRVPGAACRIAGHICRTQHIKVPSFENWWFIRRRPAGKPLPLLVFGDKSVSRDLLS